MGRRGDGEGRVTVKKQAVEGAKTLIGVQWILCEGEIARRRIEEEEPWDVEIKYCVSAGCLLSLSMCRRCFQDLLKFRPPSLFMLCECISSCFQWLP